MVRAITKRLIYNVATRLRIDLLFEFPLPAKELAKNAKRAKMLSHVFDIASPEDLLRLKELALASCSFPGDAQDIEFLKLRLSA